MLFINPMNVRVFKKTDTPQLIELFKETVHTVCRKDYTLEQLNAWAPDEIDEGLWEKRFLESYTIVAEENSFIYAFANLESDGNIDMFYVHARYQGKGIGRIVFSAIEKRAKELKLDMLTSDVSITARPFFLQLGFKVDRDYLKERNGVEFNNTFMSKINTY